MDKLNKAMLAFQVMSSILGCTIIDEYDVVVHYLPDISRDSSREIFAEKMIQLYEDHAKSFYDYGKDSFMSENTNGDKETFYMHALRFYMIPIMKDTYAKYKLGPGIWTMEGFEGINSVSKHAVRNHSNRRGNLAMQSMGYIHQLFISVPHNVAVELAKDAKKKHCNE